jgi:hypothetical protein
MCEKSVVSQRPPLITPALTLSDASRGYWQRATTVPVAIVLACIYFLFSFALFRWMEKNDWPAVESTIRWVCD